MDPTGALNPSHRVNKSALDFIGEPSREVPVEKRLDISQISPGFTLPASNENPRLLRIQSAPLAFVYVLEEATCHHGEPIGRRDPAHSRVHDSGCILRAHPKPLRQYVQPVLQARQGDYPSIHLMKQSDTTLVRTETRNPGTPYQQLFLTQAREASLGEEEHLVSRWRAQALRDSYKCTNGGRRDHTTRLQLVKDAALELCSTLDR
jgi:hypothetical protein